MAHQEAKNLDANERNGRPDAFGSRERSVSPAEETVDERERRRWERALKEMSALTGSSSARLAALDWDRTIQYTPMWSVKSGLLSTFHCQPLQGEIYIPSAARNVRGVANDDLPALAHALVQADRLACAGVAALILLPLHRLTLQFEPYNTEVVRRCQALSDKAKRHVVFELIEFEADFPQNHFTDIVRQFRSLGRAVLRRVEPDFKGLAALRAVGIQGVSVEVSGGPADEARKILDVDRIAGAAKQARLPLYAIGLPSLSLTLSAMASGCDVLAGEAVAPVTAIPSGATPFNTRSLFPFL